MGCCLFPDFQTHCVSGAYQRGVGQGVGRSVLCGGANPPIWTLCSCATPNSLCLHFSLQHLEEGRAEGPCLQLVLLPPWDINSVLNSVSFNLILSWESKSTPCSLLYRREKCFHKNTEDRLPWCCYQLFPGFPRWPFQEIRKTAGSRKNRKEREAQL